MAKTYNSIPTVATGDVLTATAWNNQATNVNNYRVPPSVGVYNTGNISVASGTFQRLSFTTASWDTDSMKGAGTVTGLSINTTGLYMVSAYIVFDASANALRGILLDKGTGTGATTVLAGQNALIPGNGNYSDLSVSVVTPLTAGDTIQCFGFQYGAGGAAVNVLGASNRIFSATWLGQVS